MWLTDVLRRGQTEAGKPATSVGLDALTRHRELILTWLPIVISMLVTAIALWPELSVPAVNLNDDAFHFLLVQNAGQALSNGQNLIDHWSPDLEMGFPQFHYYQHVPHVTVALLDRVLLGQVSLYTLFNLVRYLLMVGFPITVYWSMRTLGFSRPAATTAAALSPLFSGSHRYGFEYESYIWRGFGMYTQLWAMHLSFITVALLHRSLESRRSLLPAIISWALLVMCHLVYAYMTAVTSVIVLLMGLTRANARERIVRFLVIVIPAAIITSYFWLPFTLSNVYLSASPYLQRYKYDSFGADKILGWLVKGDLWDHGRFPVMTLIAALGSLVALTRRNSTDRLALAVFGIWLVLYFGRPTWGSLVDLMPMHRGLLIHRFIGYVDVGALMLIGVAGDWVAKQAARIPRVAPTLALTALLMVAIYPAAKERWHFYGQNGTWMRQTESAQADQSAQTILAELKKLPPGRTFAGLRTGYGTQMKLGSVAFADLLTFNRIEAVSPPYQSLSLNSDLMWDFDFTNPVHYNLFNVRYVVAPAALKVPAFLQPLTKTQRYTLYQAPTSGYFDLVSTDASFSGDQVQYHVAARDWLRGRLPGLKEHPEVLVDGTRSRFPQLKQQPLKTATASLAALVPPPATNRGQILAEGVHDGEYESQVQVDKPSTLILKVTYHPNWHATVDGKPAKTTMVMPSYIGVHLEPGKHDVRLEYRPAVLKRLLLLVGGLTLGAVIVAQWQSKRILAVGGPYWRRAETKFDQEFANFWAPMSGRIIPSARAWVGVSPFSSFLARRVLAFEVLLARAGHLPYVAGVLIAGLVSGQPLLHLKLMVGRDAIYHVPRLVELYQSLEAGELYPRWAPDFSYGYGEPLWNFYSPLFYYVGAVFHFVGFSFVASESLALFSLLMISGLGMYLLAQRFFGRLGGLVSAVAYLFAPYLLFDLYVRHFAAEFSAFAVMPFLLWAISAYLQDAKYRYLALSAVMVTLLFLSSTALTLFFLPCAGLFVLWLAVSEGSAAKLYRGLACLGFGVGLATFFWLPALMEQKYVHFSQMAERYTLYKQNFLTIGQIVHLGPWFGAPYSGSLIGYAHLALAAFAVYALLRGWVPKQARAGTWFFLGLIVLSAFFVTHSSQLFWDKLPLLRGILFPWRFLSVLAVGSAALCGLPVFLLGSKQKKRAPLLAGAIIGALLALQLSYARPAGYNTFTDADFRATTIAAKNLQHTGYREWVPKDVKEYPQSAAGQRLSVLSGKATFETKLSQPSKQSYDVHVTEPSVLRANTFYFPGWHAYVDGRRAPVDHSNRQGLMTFPVSAGNHVVSLRMQDTGTRAWATRFSAVALLVLLAWPWLPLGVGRKPFP